MLIANTCELFLIVHDSLPFLGNIVPPSAIISRLRFILNDNASSTPAEYPLGVLTAENRDFWASARQNLVENHNAESLNVVDSALFCVSLDNTSFDFSDPVPLVQNMLHGYKEGIANRWFDKSVSLIVCKDGTAGVNFEHSWGDGVAVLRYFNEIYNETINSPICQPSDVQNAHDANASENVFKIGWFFATVTYKHEQYIDFVFCFQISIWMIKRKAM